MSDYTLYHADCLDILPTLDPQSVDAVICDPPYGTTACKWDSVIPFAPMWAGIKRVLKPRGACVLFGSQPFTSALVMSNPGWFRYEWIAEKTRASGFLDCTTRPLKAHESIVVFADAEPRYYPQKTINESNRIRKIQRRRDAQSPVYAKLLQSDYREYDRTRYPRSVLRVESDDRSNQFVTRITHPTQKPLALLEYLVRTYTNAGDTVLDFAFGSGTTGHACGNLGRRFVGIEMDAGYYAIAEERIATAYAPLRHMQQVAP